MSLKRKPARLLKKNVKKIVLGEKVSFNYFLQFLFAFFHKKKREKKKEKKKALNYNTVLIIN